MIDTTKLIQLKEMAQYGFIKILNLKSIKFINNSVKI